MATAQIRELRSKFNHMTLTQQNKFIEDLERKLQGMPTTKYAEFLDECKKNYSAKIPKEVQEVAIRKENTILCMGCDKRTITTSEKCQYCGLPMNKIKELNKKMDDAHKTDMIKIVVGGVVCALGFITSFAPLFARNFSIGGIIFGIIFVLIGAVICNFGVSVENRTLGFASNSKEKVMKLAIQEKRNHEIMRKISIALDD